MIIKSRGMIESLLTIVEMLLSRKWTSFVNRLGNEWIFSEKIWTLDGTTTKWWLQFCYRSASWLVWMNRVQGQRGTRIVQSEMTDQRRATKIDACDACIKHKGLGMHSWYKFQYFTYFKSDFMQSEKLNQVENTKHTDVTCLHVDWRWNTLVSV